MAVNGVSNAGMSSESSGACALSSSTTSTGVDGDGGTETDSAAGGPGAVRGLLSILRSNWNKRASKVSQERAEQLAKAFPTSQTDLRAGKR